MEVVVKSIALLKERIGEGEIIISLEEGSTVRDLIRLMGERYGSDLENFLLTTNGELVDDVLITHNEVIVEDAGMPLSDGDLVLFIPPLQGG